MSHMRRIGTIVGALVLARAAALSGQAPAERLRSRLGAWLVQDRPLEAGPVRDGSTWALVREFYARHAGRPAWLNQQGAGRELLETLARAERAGLDPADYPVSRIATLLALAPDPDSLALLDLLLTDAFLRFGTDVSLGRVAPADVDTLWATGPRQVDLVGRLTGALDSDRVGRALEDLAPPQPGAVRLQAALARYRDIGARGGGTWPLVPAGPPLIRGAHGPRVARLLRRLEATGDLVPASVAQIFDTAVEAAVRRAQARHGLVVDGVVGPATLEALNVPVAQRVRQLELNLERWRWLPRELGRRYIIVNSAAFTLEVVDSGRTALRTSVVVGRVDWPTPIVSGSLTEVTFNPRWNIPRSIAVHEVLPAVRRDPAVLVREGIHVLSDTTERAVELDPATIPWGRITDSAFAYRLWQDPGPRNPLGRIRFTIPSRFGVALHDTPEPQLFSPLARAFSHGCVRVADAEQLAAYVLRGLPGWTEDSLRAAAAQGSERRIAVPEQVPVYLAYWTAWVREDGEVEFRPDVYGWDAELAEAIRSSSCAR